MTTEELKALLGSPLVLLAAMYIATALSAVKQIVSARRDGIAVPTCVEYFGTYWPETLTAVLGNGLAFATLIATDTLNLASALGIGYATNSLADLLRSGGRSATISGQKDDGSQSGA
jgi:hypothetical protein